MRMGEGRETFNRLLNWDRGQAPSERLAAIILSKEGFNLLFSGSSTTIEKNVICRRLNL